jgi:hypothetical protein
MAGKLEFEGSSGSDSEGGDGCGALRFCLDLAMVG